MGAVVQSLWIGSDLSIVEVLCIRSFLHNGHDFHLYSYQPLKNVPEGTVQKDANEILPEKAIYRSASGRISSFADWFRWEMLRVRGGLWVDMDVICLRPFEFSDDVVFGWESKTNIAIGVLEFPPAHFLSTVMAKACDNVNLFQPIDSTKTVAKKILRKVIFGKEKSRIYTRFMEPGGPAYFAKFVEYYGMIEFAKPINWFYPISSWNWEDIFKENAHLDLLLKDSYAIHLWNDKLRQSPNFDKNSPPLENTLFGKLADRYLQERWRWER